MCKVTSTELKNNLSYYIELSNKEDVYITKNDKVVSILTSPRNKSFVDFLKLEGCLKKYDNGKDYKEIIGEEIINKYGCNCN